MFAPNSKTVKTTNSTKENFLLRKLLYRHIDNTKHTKKLATIIFIEVKQKGNRLSTIFTPAIFAIIVPTK